MVGKIMKKRTIIIIVSIFIIMSLIIPLSYGDDLDWGGQGGIERLNHFFQGYNGRYLGNLAIMIISRSIALRVVFYTIINSGIILLMSKLIGSKSSSSLVFSLLLLYTMPSKVYGQTFGWFAGFANYNIGIFFCLLSIYLVKENKNMIYIFLSAFASQFFMENITIFNVFASVVLFFILKETSVYKRMIYIGTTILGAIIMFLNPVYFSISNHADGYRTINLDSIYQVLVTNYTQYLLVGNLSLVITLTVLSFMLVNKKNSIINYYTITYTILIILLKGKGYTMVSVPFLLANIITIMSFVYLFCIAYLIKISDRFQSNLSLILFYGFSSGVMLSPFLVITPFGPRAAFTSYVFLAMVSTALWDEVVSTSENIQSTRFISIIFSGVVICLLVIHSFNRYVMKERISQPILKEKNEIIYVDVPFPNYGQHLSPPTNLVISPRTFKEKHHIPKDMKISFVPYRKK